MKRSALSLDRLVGLRDQEKLASDSYERLLGWALAPPDRTEWHRGLRLTCLILGVILVTSGVIYFGAFNWEALHRFQKLGLMETLVIGGFLGVMTRGLDSTVGQVCLTAASVLVGALLVVYSQVYQSGADAYRLFLGWGVLILPWTLASRSSVQWVLQVALFNTTFVLWWDQVIDGGFPAFALLYLALNGAVALAWRRPAPTPGWKWRPVGDLFLANALVPVTFSACVAPWEWDLNLVSLLALGASLFALQRFEGERLPSMTMLAASALTVAGSFTVWVLHELDLLGILLMAGAILAEMALAVKWLRAVHARQVPNPTPTPTGLPSDPVASKSPAQELAALVELDLAEAELVLGQDEELPWYVKVLTGIGAWIASWFLIGFFLIWMWRSIGAVGSYGTVLFLGSIFLRRSEAAEGLFVQYTCLAANLASQVLILMAIAEGQNESVLMTASGLLLVQIVALLSYPDQVGRYLFAIAAIVSGGFSLAELLPDQLGWSVWLLAVACLLTALWSRPQFWLQGPFRALFLPTALGMTTGFFGILQVLVFEPLGSNPFDPAMAVAFTVLALAVGTYFRAPLVALLGLVVLGLITQSVPELMASVLMAMVSFRARNNFALLISLSFLLSFGVFYYYNLDLTLWFKALTLIGSGAVFLLVRLFLGKEESSGGVAHAF